MDVSEQREVLAIARRVAGRYRTRHDYADIESDAVLGAWLGWTEYEPGRGERSREQHAGISVRYRVIDGLRARLGGPNQSVALVPLDAEWQGKVADPCEQVVDHVAVVQILEGAGLRASWRWALVWHDGYGRSYAEMGREIDRSLQRVRDMRTRAVRHARRGVS